MFSNHLYYLLHIRTACNYKFIFRAKPIYNESVHPTLVLLFLSIQQNLVHQCLVVVGV